MKKVFILILWGTIVFKKVRIVASADLMGNLFLFSEFILNTHIEISKETHYDRLLNEMLRLLSLI